MSPSPTFLHFYPLYSKEARLVKPEITGFFFLDNDLWGTIQARFEV
jgi:hypothetical protein